MSPILSRFRRVTYTCRECGARQRIPLRRVHVCERFHGLSAGAPMLIACPACDTGLQIPPRDVAVVPAQPPPNAFIHANY
jgi:hypothetical protein